MSSVINTAKSRQSAAEPRARSRLTVRQKRWLLAAHLFFLAAWLGGGLGSLALNLRALGTTDPQLLRAIYIFADLLHTTIIRGGAGGSLLTGLSLAYFTQWGLVRFYWIMAKEALTLLAVTTDLIIIRWNSGVVEAISRQGPAVFSSPFYLGNRGLLFGASALQLSLLAVIIVISIFKPWGQRGRLSPSRAQAAA